LNRSDIGKVHIFDNYEFIAKEMEIEVIPHKGYSKHTPPKLECALFSFSPYFLREMYNDIAKI
jgi:hypothetical protein